MPCYCDIPDESDQVEIEKRCKTRMYFDATAIINIENLNKAVSLNLEIKQFPLPEANTALCNICKILTKDQMQMISAHYYKIKWKYETLYDWYQQHCKDDKYEGHEMLENSEVKND